MWEGCSAAYAHELSLWAQALVGASPQTPGKEQSLIIPGTSFQDPKCLGMVLAAKLFAQPICYEVAS